MASMTAQLVVGTPDRYHGGIYPRQIVWLSENSRPGWVLQPAHVGSSDERYDVRGQPESTVWVPHRP